MRVAVTGGPGVGKTSLLNALRKRGYPVVSEVAREIIADRRARGLSPRPPPAEFARMILEEDFRRYDNAPRKGVGVPTFFDRCVLDSMAMIAQLGLLRPQDRKQLLARYRYYPTAFILPPWREIYATDSERDQTYDEAVAVFHTLRDWYLGCSYHLIEVPKGSVELRCEFVIGILERAQG